jgi:hypothetical protein
MPLPSRRQRNRTPPDAGALVREGDTRDTRDTRVARRPVQDVLNRGDVGAADEPIAAEGPERSTRRACLGRGGVA